MKLSFDLSKPFSNTFRKIPQCIHRGRNGKRRMFFNFQTLHFSQIRLCELLTVQDAENGPPKLKRFDDSNHMLRRTIKFLGLLENWIFSEKHSINEKIIFENLTVYSSRTFQQKKNYRYFNIKYFHALLKIYVLLDSGKQNRTFKYFPEKMQFSTKSH